MGKFYDVTIWLEDRESELLAKYNFNEEIPEIDIDHDKRWILRDLCIKGFLYTYNNGNLTYYIGTCGYKQHFI